MAQLSKLPPEHQTNVRHISALHHGILLGFEERTEPESIEAKPKKVRKARV